MLSRRTCQANSYRVYSRDGETRTCAYFGVEEGEALVDVLDFMHSHLAAVGLGELLARDDLEQLEQLLAVGEVHEQILHVHPGLRHV